MKYCKICGKQISYRATHCKVCANTGERNTRWGQVPWNKGKAYSKEYRERLSLSHKGKHHSPNTEFKKGLIPWNKGVKLGPSWSWMKGKHHTEESNQKNREAHLGSKSPNWKGGVSVGENQKKYWVMKAEERRARKLNAEGTYTMEEWETLKAVYNHRCPACSRGEPEVELVRDHIRPLITGGTNYINNIQPLCRSCNAKKWSKEILYVQQLALVSS